MKPPDSLLSWVETAAVEIQMCHSVSPEPGILSNADRAQASQCVHVCGHFAAAAEVPETHPFLTCQMMFCVVPLALLQPECPSSGNNKNRQHRNSSVSGERESFALKGMIFCSLRTSNLRMRFHRRKSRNDVRGLPVSTACSFYFFNVCFLCQKNKMRRPLNSLILC